MPLDQANPYASEILAGQRDSTYNAELYLLRSLVAESDPLIFQRGAFQEELISAAFRSQKSFLDDQSAFRAAPLFSRSPGVSCARS